jgi:hypothetical protein
MGISLYGGDQHVSPLWIDSAMWVRTFFIDWYKLQFRVRLGRMKKTKERGHWSSTSVTVSCVSVYAVTSSFTFLMTHLFRYVVENHVGFDINSREAELPRWMWSAVRTFPRVVAALQEKFRSQES